MTYPVWDVPFGLPLMIAVMANIHVFIAHFAVGGGLFLVVTETIARRRGDEALLAFAARYSRMFILWTLVLGTITGVGIWFTIGLIHPAGTSALIHLFVWFWATEWVMFAVEIAAALIYNAGWKRMEARAHLTVGWIYFIAAYGSLVVINGIITFMLTPGGWTQTGGIWAAFFNPTYLPSLIIRTLLAVLMASLFTLAAATRLEPRLKAQVVRISGIAGAAALAAMAPVAMWYFGALPETVVKTVAGGWRGVANAVAAFKWTLGLALAGIVFSAVLRPKGLNRMEALTLALLGLGIISAFEWSREAARKPFVIRDYMFSNELLVDELEAVKATGLEARVVWKGDDPAERGRELYQAACARCHSLTGYNPLVKPIAQKGWSEDELAELIPRTGHFRGAMPPFAGNAEEARKIAEYLLNETRARTPQAPRATDGEAVWKRNCQLCHDAGYFKKLGTFDGMSVDETAEMIGLTGEMMEEMPPFMGSESDARALAEYIQGSLKQEPSE